MKKPAAKPQALYASRKAPRRDPAQDPQPGDVLVFTAYSIVYRKSLQHHLAVVTRRPRGVDVLDGNYLDGAGSTGGSPHPYTLARWRQMAQDGHPVSVRAEEGYRGWDAVQESWHREHGKVSRVERLPVKTAELYSIVENTSELGTGKAFRVRVVGQDPNDEDSAYVEIVEFAPENFSELVELVEDYGLSGVRITERGPVGLLHGIEVSHNARGQGLGSRMLQEALELARTEHLLAVYVPAEPRPVAFYQRFGFQTLGKSKSGHLTWMRLPLLPDSMPEKKGVLLLDDVSALAKEYSQLYYGIPHTNRDMAEMRRRLAALSRDELSSLRTRGKAAGVDPSFLQALNGFIEHHDGALRWVRKELLHREDGTAKKITLGTRVRTAGQPAYSRSVQAPVGPGSGVVEGATSGNTSAAAQAKRAIGTTAAFLVRFDPAEALRAKQRLWWANFAAGRDALIDSPDNLAQQMHDVAWELGYEQAQFQNSPYDNLVPYEPLAQSVGVDLRAAYDLGRNSKIL